MTKTEETNHDGSPDAKEKNYKNNEDDIEMAVLPENQDIELAAANGQDNAGYEENESSNKSD